jgi:hypothetical protein
MIDVSPSQSMRFQLNFNHCLMYLVYANPPLIPKRIIIKVDNKIFGSYSLHPEKKDNLLIHYTHGKDEYYVLPLMHNHLTLESLETDIYPHEIIMNASQVDNLELLVEHLQNPNGFDGTDKKQKFHVIARNFQIMRTKDGMSGMAFSK